MFEEKMGIRLGSIYIDDISDFISEITIIGKKQHKQLVKKSGNGGEVYIEVYPRERIGNPHFHICCNNFKNGDCCVMLDNTLFWPHDNHNTILSKVQMKQIDTWMREPNINEPWKTNWQVACDIWMSGKNTDKGFNINTQPNYSIMCNDPQYIYNKGGNN